LDHKKLLYITRDTSGRNTGGRELLSALHAKLLRSLFGPDFSIFIVPESKDGHLAKLFNGMRGLVDGLSNSVLRKIATQIRANATTTVFIDGSNLGSLAMYLKRSEPHVEIITFYHNVETRFFLGALSRSFSLRSLLVFFVNHLAEKSATRFSDRIICLNNRDSELLYQYFQRRASHICPLALQRPKPPKNLAQCALPETPYALFVGGAFYANLQGIKWYSKYISPHLAIHLYVIGHGLDQSFKHYPLPSNITILGSVHHLEPWYLNSAFVVAPIFDGSGMKTKVAEALMYGKKIVGTPEAFVGYETALPTAGWCCYSAQEFLSACITAADGYSPLADSKLISIYKRYYSPDAASSNLYQILRS